MALHLRLLILLLGASILVSVVWAEQRNVPVVGLLMVRAGPHDPVVEALRKGLNDLGYVEGRNIAIEYRGAEGQVDRLPQLAAELVRLKVDVIVAATEPSIRAAVQATRTIPIVMVAYDNDPVASGMVQSLSRPGGNVTGLFTRQSELLGKRLELLKETIPGLSRVAVFFDSFGARQLDELKVVARSLGIALELVEFGASYDFDAAIKTAKRKKADAVLVLFSPVFYVSRARISELALQAAAPTMFEQPDFVEVGGLMSYGFSSADTFGRAAYFLDRILKGAKPNDLPIEQPSKFWLAVNPRTAKVLGLTIPQAILLQADEVIR